MESFFSFFEKAPFQYGLGQKVSGKHVTLNELSRIYKNQFLTEARALCKFL